MGALSAGCNAGNQHMRTGTGERVAPPSPLLSRDHQVCQDVHTRPECLQHVIHAVSVLNGRWTPAVLAALYVMGSPCRFSALHRSIDGISQKELARHLSNLVYQGVIRRESSQRSVRYSLTSDGMQLLVRMKSLGEWSQARMNHTGGGTCRARTWLDPILR